MPHNKRPAPKGSPHSRRNRPRKEKSPDGTYWLYGIHAVRAAFSNKNRRILRILANASGAEALDAATMATRPADRPTLEPLDSRALPPGIQEQAVHQGLLAEVWPLPAPDPALLDLPDTRRVIALDQVTDPQNMGAILRTCAVFGVQAVIVPRHNTPGETGALAKAASGALEIVPILRVANLSRSLDGLKKSGFFVIGLAGEAEQAIGDYAPLNRCVLVAGAEGRGLRRLVREHCDATVALPVAPKAKTAGIDSLNVATAVAVALHDLVRCQGERYQQSIDDRPNP